MRISIPGTAVAIDADRLTQSPFRSRRIRLITLFLLLLTLLTWRPSPPFPPTYPEAAAERAIRHDGKVVRFDQPKGDFSEQFQRIILYRHLASTSGRSFAYEPIQVDSTILSFKLFRWPWRSARLPLSAFATLEGGVPSSSVSGCKAASVEIIVQAQAKLKDNETCIRIKGDLLPEEFYWSPAPVSMVELIKTPLYTPSTRVLSILNRALPHIAPETGVVDRKPTPLRHLLVLELRGGGAWEDRCEDAFEHTRPFYGFNTLPKHPGNEVIPPQAGMTRPARRGLYKAKCHPEIIEIIARARRMRKNHPLLKSAYVITDAPTKWVNEVRKWLLSEGWEKVWIGSRDVWAGREEREVGQMVELEMARRAGVYVGNGFSPFSSNAVLIRRKDGIHPDLTQYW